MEPRKLSILFAFFPYGSNGGISQEHPSIRSWYARTRVAMANDSRFGKIWERDFVDTPITMTRCEAVHMAKSVGADILMMMDSDQHPDVHVGELAGAKPFFPTAFDFIYERYEKGPNVVFAPYCGSPPHENVFVFRWANLESGCPNPPVESKAFTREEAATRTGIEAVACGPTGVIMYDMRVFDDIVKHPYFNYEWEGDGPACKHCGEPKPGPRAYKASTEDVVMTRDLALLGQMKLGYNPLHCAWDCWAGHYKPKCVKKPSLTTIDQLNDRFVQAVRRGNRSGESIINIGNGHKDVRPTAVKSSMTQLYPNAEETTAMQENNKVYENHSKIAAELQAALATLKAKQAECDAILAAHNNTCPIPSWPSVIVNGDTPINGNGHDDEPMVLKDPNGEIRKAIQSGRDQGYRYVELEQRNGHAEPAIEESHEIIGRENHVHDEVKRRVIRQRYLSETELGPVEDMGLMDSNEFFQASTNDPEGASWGRLLNV